jgi:anti-sigma factor RsiW
MMAMSKKISDLDPGAIEALLPWYAAGTLNARDTRRVEEALASNPELTKQYAAIREEYAETILLNENLGAPSSRAMQKLFAAIDAEPAPTTTASLHISARIARFFASRSPRTLANAAAVAALALLLQGGVIGAMWMKQTDTFQTASLSGNERGISAERGPVALVRFAADAKVADVTAFLDSYHASIVDGARSGMFRLQFSGSMSPQDVAGLMNRLQSEKIISLAVLAQ